MIIQEEPAAVPSSKRQWQYNQERLSPSSWARRLVAALGVPASPMVAMEASEERTGAGTGPEAAGPPQSCVNLSHWSSLGVAAERGVDHRFMTVAMAALAGPHRPLAQRAVVRLSVRVAQVASGVMMRVPAGAITHGLGDTAGMARTQTRVRQLVVGVAAAADTSRRTRRSREAAAEVMMEAV